MSAVAGCTDSPSPSGAATRAPTSTTKASSRQETYEAFQCWALHNYGDTGKTKTVTRKKYERIIGILSGEEAACSENSKFRFWVKAKGFRLGPAGTEEPDQEEQVLYVPTKPTSGLEEESERRDYKRVAVVEDFFSIIYNVHVEMDGRGGKHAGQKRTYRAIAETYAFLPREAVTRFLMSCSDCQKRMHLSAETNNNDSQPASEQPSDQAPPIVDFSMPITTTYLNHMRGKGSQVDENFMYQNEREDSMSSVESEVSRDRTPTPPVECSLSPKPPDLKQEITHTIGAIRGATPTHIRTYTTEGAVGDLSVNMVDREVSSQDEKPAVNTVVESRSPEERLQPERKRRASDEISLDSSTKASECGKDDDDDEDGDDDDDKIPAHGDFDPERLKAFNMFVRLFVDENLDRMVPISKQPKDKIQAILEACDRQFPEFHERSRKRIRTYLKSCRRMRRSKENGWESLRPTPPHLTSAAAESILAQACENESNNAKRMRMGLEPLPKHLLFEQATSMNPVTVAASTASQPQQPPQQPSPACQTAPAATQPAAHQPSQPQQPQPPHLDRQPTLTAGPEYIRHAPPTAFRPPHEIPSPFFTNGNGIFRPGFPATYHGQHPAHHHAPVIQHTQMTNTIQNGPTDLSMKSKSQGSSKNQLNPSEVATIKQLIAGYRESAAFLYRSADELEQLLLQQN